IRGFHVTGVQDVCSSDLRYVFMIHGREMELAPRLGCEVFKRHEPLFNRGGIGDGLPHDLHRRSIDSLDDKVLGTGRVTFSCVHVSCSPGAVSSGAVSFYVESAFEVGSNNRPSDRAVPPRTGGTPAP